MALVFATEWCSILSLAGLVSIAAGAWHLVECHEDGCHRFARHPHGHFRLCGVHHPGVGDDRRADIAAVTAAKAATGDGSFQNRGTGAPPE
jgi:hypothetical protein